MSTNYVHKDMSETKKLRKLRYSLMLKPSTHNKLHTLIQSSVVKTREFWDVDHLVIFLLSLFEKYKEKRTR